MKELKINNNLRLAPISLEYAQNIFEGFDKAVIEFLPIDNPPSKIEETISFIEHSIEQIKHGTDLVWVILFNKNFIGCCGIHGLKSRQPNFGLWIKKDEQGKGYGKKIVDFLLYWALNRLDIEFLKYPVDKRNRKSISLLKNHNAKLFGEYEMGNEKKLDVIEYRLYKNEKGNIPNNELS